MPLSFYYDNIRLVLLDICCTISILTAVAATFLFPLILKITDNLELTKGGMLRSLQSKLVDVIESCQESIVVMSQDWSIITANKITSHFFGENLSVSFLSLVHDEDKDILIVGFDSVLNMELKRLQKVNNQPYLATPEDIDVEVGVRKIPSTNSENDLTMSEQVRVEFRVKDKQGDWVWIESTLMVSATPHVSEESSGPMFASEFASSKKSNVNFLMMSRNVNNKKREEHLRKEEEKFIATENENIAKLKYITCCAHDLKTPLQSFNFAVDLLEASGLQADQLDILHQARVSSLLLSMTISQTMDTSKVGFN
jgi:hypothetical protein